MTVTQSFLGDISSVITKGTTPTSVGFDFSESGVPFLRVQNLAGGAVDLTKTPLFISTATHKALSRSTIYPGDVLISIAGTIGRAAVVSPEDPAEMNSNQAVGIIRLKNGVNRRYILHWLQSNEAQSQIRGAQVTGTITNLSLTELRKLQIPLPPLAEQKRIAAILDAADALRTKRREALAQLDALLQSTFLTLFGDPVTNPMGWKKCCLGDLFVVIKNGANVVQAEADSGEWAVSRIETIWNGTIDSDRVKWTTADPSLLATHRIQVGDILFSHINSPEHIAKTAIYMGEPKILIHGINLLRMCVDRKFVDPIWMIHFLKAPTTRSHFRTRCKKAVNQASLNQTDIKTFDAYLPPLPLQQKFAAIVESIERQKTTQRAHLAELDALFAALQHRAFRGEL